MLPIVLLELGNSDLARQRSAIKLLKESGNVEAVGPLIKLVRCHHTDQHSRIMAIHALEEITGLEIRDMPEVKCKFVDRYIARRPAENDR
jgi:hypothetical protein